MRTTAENITLKKGETMKLEGLAIVGSGSVELILQGKPIWVYPTRSTVGYELVFKELESVFPKIRALDDTEITYIESSELRRLYKENKRFKKSADKAITLTIKALLKEVLTHSNTTFDIALKRLVESARGTYCPVNIAQLCKEWGYSRNQFYKAVKKLKELGIYYKGHCLIKEEEEVKE
ncbi:hypothetical protein [Propionigenium maris]|nr:hypothetical protein [Propionigenium maris]